MRPKKAQNITGILTSVVFLALTLSFSHAFAQTTGTTDTPVEKIEDTVPFNGSFTQDYSPKDQSLKVSDPVELRFKFTHSIDSEIIPPEMLPSQRWHIVDSSSEKKPIDASKQETNLKMTVSVNRPGATTLPPLKFTALDRSGSSAEITGMPISVKFISSLPDTTELSFKAPKPPVEIWIEDYTLAWIGGIGFVGALFLGLFFFMKNRQIKLEIPEPPRAAHDVALEKLATVAGQEISVDDEKNMAFYVLISEAIREYMGTIWNFPGTELTTTEILSHLREKVFPLGISQDDIGAFLKETDYVKFAGSKPDNESNARILRRAFSIIELTKSLSLSQYTTELVQFRELYGDNGTDGDLSLIEHKEETSSDVKTNETNANRTEEIQSEDIKDLDEA